ncbi:hypothetical protein [Rubinisphaera italica]|uniref:Uncharacterized protein n=1 Tax=Rubinisphaera italica TaxID=2527969 RepID=A0A5C5XF91_9PLAN|nr:hypothetical protein [Rubinisphaera italica]TWT60815.1 hypothetical protein Pan54_15420 [Rubinisphaera italica]
MKQLIHILDTDARPNCWELITPELEELFVDSQNAEPSSIVVKVNQISDSHVQDLYGGIKVVSPTKRHAITVQNKSSQQLHNVLLEIKLESIDKHFEVPEELALENCSTHIDYFFIEEWKQGEVIELFMEGAWAENAKRQTYKISYRVWSDQLKTEDYIVAHQNYLDYLTFIQSRSENLFQDGELESALLNSRYCEFISRSEQDHHILAVSFLNKVNQSLDDSNSLFKFVENLNESNLDWRLGKHTGEIGIRVTSAPEAGQGLFGPTDATGEARLYLPENPTFFSTFKTNVKFDSQIGRYKIQLAKRVDGISTPNPYSKYDAHDYNDTTESQTFLVKDRHSFEFYFIDGSLCGHGSQGTLFLSKGKLISDRFHNVQDDPQLLTPAVNRIKLNLMLPEDFIASQLTIDNYPPLEHSLGEINRFYTDKFDRGDPATGDLVWSLDFSNLRPNIYSILNGQLSAWDTVAGENSRVEGEYYHFMSTSRGDKIVATRNRDYHTRVDVIDAKTGRAIHQFEDIGKQFVFANNGKKAFLAGYSPQVRLLDLEPPFSVKPMAEHRSNVNHVCLSHNEEYVVCQYEKALFSIWKRIGDDFQNIGEYDSVSLGTAKGHYASAAHPNKPLIATIVYHGDDSKFRTIGPYTIEIWDYLKRELVYKTRIETSAWCIMLSNDWKWLFLGLGGGQIAAIDTVTGIEDLRLTGHNTIVSSLRLSSDQRFLLSGTYGDWVILWGLPERFWLNHSQSKSDATRPVDAPRPVKVTQPDIMSEVPQPDNKEGEFKLYKEISNIKTQMKLIEVKKKRMDRKFYEKHIVSVSESFDAIEEQKDISATDKVEVEKLRLSFQSLIKE